MLVGSVVVALGANVSQGLAVTYYVQHGLDESLLNNTACSAVQVPSKSASWAVSACNKMWR